MAGSTIVKAKGKAVVVIPTRYSKREVVEIEKACMILRLPSRSAFIREAVLSRLKEVKGMRIVEMRDVSIDEASRMIDEYLEKNPGVHYVSELIEELGLEPRMAFEAVRKMMQEGKVRAVKEK